MNKTFLYYLFTAALLLSACGKKTKATDEPFGNTFDGDAVVTNDSTEIIDALTVIYDDVFSFYNNNATMELGSFDEKYLSEEFLSLQRQVEEISRDNVGEIFGLDYDHWIQAQDWDAVSMQIKTVDLSGPQPRADIIIIHGGSSIYPTDIPLTVLLLKDQQGQWRIDDFVRGNTSEKQFLRDAVKNAPVDHHTRKDEDRLIDELFGKDADDEEP